MSGLSKKASAMLSTVCLLGSALALVEAFRTAADYSNIAKHRSQLIEQFKPQAAKTCAAIGEEWSILCPQEVAEAIYDTRKKDAEGLSYASSIAGAGMGFLAGFLRRRSREIPDPQP